MDKEFSKHSCKYTSLHIKDVCPKYAEIQLWGLIIGPFLIPAAEALVFLLRQLVFEKGKEVSPPSLAAAYGVIAFWVAAKDSGETIIIISLHTNIIIFNPKSK